MRDRTGEGYERPALVGIYSGEPVWEASTPARPEMNSKDAHEKDLILNMSMRLAAVPGNLTRVHLGKLGKTDLNRTLIRRVVPSVGFENNV